MCFSRSIIVNYANTNTHNVIMPIRFLKNRNKNKIQWEADDDRLFVHEFRLSNDRVLFVRYMGSCKAHFETFKPNFYHPFLESLIFFGLEVGVCVFIA